MRKFPRKLSIITAVAGVVTPMMTGVALAVERTSGSRALTFCDGGAQEAVLTNTQNTQVTTASGVFVPIPSTTLPGGSSGAIGDTDAYTLTFSGEAGNTGGGSWEIKGQVSVDGGPFVDIDPVDSNTFQSGNPRQTHTMTWCRRLAAPVNTNFQVVWRKVGGGSAIVDGFLIQVQRSD